LQGTRRASCGIHMVTRPPTPPCLSHRQNIPYLYSAQAVPVQLQLRGILSQTANFSLRCTPLSHTHHWQVVGSARVVEVHLINSKPIPRPSHSSPPCSSFSSRGSRRCVESGTSRVLLFFEAAHWKVDLGGFIDISNGLASDTTHTYSGRLLRSSSSCRIFYMAYLQRHIVPHCGIICSRYAPLTSSLQLLRFTFLACHTATLCSYDARVFICDQWRQSLLE